MSVLIVAPPDDVHALGVLREVQDAGGHAYLLDSGDLPHRAAITHLIRKSGDRVVINHKDHGNIDVSTLSAVWWRRPQPYELPQIAHPSLRRFAAAEWTQAFTGTLAATVRRFVNPIDRSRLAVLKAVQLHAARRCGLAIPDTAITSSAADAREFLTTALHGGIYKTFTGTTFGLHETRPIGGDEDLVELDRLSSCPAIFQDNIRGSYDLRVTVIGDSIFAAKVDYLKGAHPVDSRTSRVPITPIEIPDDLRSKLLSLMDELGLSYGAIDLRMSAEHGYVFFEVNPDGQFLWIEIESGLPISAALARHLMAA